MKTFKIIDLAVQAVLIIGGVIYAIISISRPGLNLFDPYIVIASWQIISYGIHHFLLTPTVFQHHRIRYGRIVLAILILGYVLLMALLLEVSQAVPVALIYLAAVTVFFPLLAIYYVVTCWKEYRVMINKELIHLK